MRKLFIDLDGTLLDGWLDKGFNLIYKYSSAEDALSWYKTVANTVTHALNIPLLNKLKHEKEKGNKLYVWTNRFDWQKEHTVEQLGNYKNLFEDFIFGNGIKSKTRGLEEIWDNDPKYSVCSNSFKPIDTYLT